MFFFLFFYATFAWLTFFVFSLSSYWAAPGAMANHLITNALLRPHGTNNPYNTLLGESAVYNNPSVSMYNAQGVLEFLSNFSSENSIFCGLFLPISFFFSSFPLPPPPQTLCFFGTGHRNDPPFSFISVHFSILCRLFSMSNQVHFKRHSSVLLKAFTVVLILIFFFLIPLLLYCFGLVCVFCQMYPFLCCLHISLLNHSFQKQEHLWR